MVDSAAPLVDDLDMGIFYENTNSGNTTDVELAVRGASISVWGDLRRFNESGGQYTTDEFIEAALGNVEHREMVYKFGRNSDVDPTSDPEDVWEGGGLYTGHPTGSPETVEVFSSSAADDAAGTGARTIRIHGLKTSSSTDYETEDLSMDGTTEVESTNTWYRVNRIEVLTAGTGGSNAGVITCRHSSTTDNVFAAIQVGYNQTTIAAYTIPASKKALLKRMRVSIVRANGSAGSATITLRVRASGSVYRAIRNMEVQTGGETNDVFSGGLVFNAGDDILLRVEQVSDANTVVSGELEMLLIDV